MSTAPPDPPRNQALSPGLGSQRPHEFLTGQRSTCAGNNSGAPAFDLGKDCALDASLIDLKRLLNPVAQSACRWARCPSRSISSIAAEITMVGCETNFTHSSDTRHSEIQSARSIGACVACGDVVHGTKCGSTGFPVHGSKCGSSGLARCWYAERFSVETRRAKRWHRLRGELDEGKVRLPVRVSQPDGWCNRRSDVDGCRASSFAPGQFESTMTGLAPFRLPLFPSTNLAQYFNATYSGHSSDSSPSCCRFQHGQRNQL